MYQIQNCHVCGEAQRTIVCEYNRLPTLFEIDKYMNNGLKRGKDQQA
jgi:hypothetical protein